MTTFAEHWQGRARSLAVFGDSITAGSEASVPQHSWANLLADRLGVARLDNRGISATVLQNSPDATGRPRADNGLSRYARDLLAAERADLIAMLYGFNDARYTAAPATLNHDGFRRDYVALIEGLLAAGVAADAICLGSPPHIPDAGFAVDAENGFAGQSRVEFQRYVRTVELIARDAGTYYAPVNEWMGAKGADRLVSADHVHPNDAGHARIAEAFADAIPSRDRYLK
jgi:lysophospholipase L1-like esterase